MGTENGEKIPRLKRRQKIIIIVLCGLLLYSLAGFYLVPWLLQTQLEKRISLLLDRQTTIDQVKFNPFTLVLQLEGFVIKSHEGDKAPLCKIDSLTSDFSSYSLFKRALVLERLKITGPYFKIIRKEDLSYNFSDLLPAPKAKTKKKNESGNFRFSLNNIEITGGIIELADQPHKTFHWINGITISLPSISNLPKLINSRVQPSFAAVVNGAPLVLKGQTKPFASSHDTEFNINFSDLDLSYYLSYIPGKRNFTVSSGRLSTHLILTFQQPANSPVRLQLTGTTTLADVIIESSNQETKYRFVKLPKITTKFGPGNLLAGELFLDDITLEKPDINLKLKPDGIFYLPKIAAAVENKVEKRSRQKTEAKVKTEKRKKKFTCHVAHLKINHGKLDFRDERVVPIFTAHYKPFNLEVSNFSNEPEKQAEYTLKVTSDAAEELQIDGSFILDPLTLRANLSFNNVPINRYQPYYQQSFNGNVSSGKIAANGVLNFIQRIGEKSETSINDFTVKLTELEVKDPDGTRVLTLPELKIVAERVELDKRDIIITSCRARDALLKILRRTDGRFNLMDFIPPETNIKAADREVEPAANDDQATDWHLFLQQGSLKNFQLELKDQSLNPPATLVADHINLELDQLGTRSAEKGRLKLDLSLARTGQMSVAGTLALIPLEADLNIVLNKLPLRAFQSYLAENVDMVLVNGQLQTSGKLHFKQKKSGKPQLSFRGDAKVRRLKIVDGLKAEEFLAWQDVSLHKFSFKSQPLTFSLDKLTATRLKSQIILLPDGRSNLQVMMGRKPAAQPSPEPFDITLKKVLINQSDFRFTDQRMSPVFHLELTDLKGEIDKLSSKNQEPSRINLQGSLNGQSPVLVKGSIAPLAQNLFADLSISGDGIGMTTFTPYSGKFIGQTIGKGKLYLDLKYKVRKGQLRAENMIFLDQFNFGTAIDSPDALSLPVKLAVALLRDRRGEIHLKIPVHGNLNDPQFSIGGVIVKIFVNLIAKAVTSPFALLGSLAGGGSQNLNQVIFDPGMFRLTEKAKRKLDKLAKILYERPGLKLDIIGHADPASDRPALHEAYFQKLLKAQKFKDVVRKNEAIASVDKITVEKSEFKTYLWKAYKKAPITKQKNLIGMVKKILPEEQERLLRASIKVDDGSLLDLARQRDQVIMSYLAGKGPVETQRLFLTEPVLANGNTSSGADNRLVEMKIK